MEKLGTLLLGEGLITKDQLEEALALARDTDQRIGIALREMGFAEEDEVAQAMAMQMETHVVDLMSVAVDPEALALIPARIAVRFRLIPLAVRENRLILAMADPYNVLAQDAVRTVTGCELELVVATESGIDAALLEHYGMTVLEDEAAADDEPARNGASEASPLWGRGDKERSRLRMLVEGSEEPSPGRLFNALVEDAVHRRASDIHIEPLEDAVQVRYRVDGMLRAVTRLQKRQHYSLISRIKILADMDISEKRRPQDGRAKVHVDDRDVDLRISTLPTFHGEKAAIRILDKSQALLNLSDLGFQPRDLEVFRSCLARRRGMILITGPTGSGKTTTLYAALNEIQSAAKNIVTVEDPIEYQLEGINQVQVNERAGLTFATALRSILRQDPNVLLVGEIRDEETAEIAFRASLTGHLVLSTLHTNDAPSAITRLLDLNLSPYFITSSLAIVAAQRLVRKIHSPCKEQYRPNPQMVERFNLVTGDGQPIQLYRGRGCAGCDHTGYRGLTGLFQILPVDDEIREMIDAGASAAAITRTARQLGMRSLLEDGLAKVVRGITTLEEVAGLAAGQELRETFIDVEALGARPALRLLHASDR